MPTWCSTPCGILGLETRFVIWAFLVFDVLNALRHLRFGNLRLTLLQVCFVRCSTPCGILGLETPPHPAPAAPLACVLNALRHLRFGNVKPLLRGFCVIFVLNALRHLRFGNSNAVSLVEADSWGAQRLAAS